MPRKLKEKRKAPTPKTPTVKEVPQESAAVLWLMERTGFDKNELLELMVRFKKIAADRRIEGKGKKKREVVSVNGGGDDRISEEEFALYFSKVMKVETAHAKALFRVADSRTRDGFLEFREFLGLMAILYRGSPEEKLRIIFDAYDEDRSGEIDERKMRRMLTSTLAIESKSEKDATIAHTIALALTEIDTDGSRTITYEELLQAFRARPQLLSEYFGQNIIGSCESLQLF